MKIDRLDAHDRLLHFKKDQSANLFSGVEDCRLRNPNCVAMQQHFPYVYIFAHPRTAEDGVTKKMIWQPRLIKPKSQTNSYLFRLQSNTDIVEIVWLLPPREMWSQYEPGKMTHNLDVMTSINNFVNYRRELDAPHKEDWSIGRIRKKLEEIDEEFKKCKKI